MSNILNNVSLTNIFGNTSDVLSAISPFLTFLVGLLLAFLVIKTLVGFTHKEKKN